MKSTETYDKGLKNEPIQKKFKVHPIEAYAIEQYLQANDIEFTDLVMSLLSEKIGFERVTRKVGAPAGERNGRYNPDKHK